MQDDYFLNKTLRRKLKIEKEMVKKEEEFKKSKNFALPLLKYSQEDEVLSKTANFMNYDSKIDKFNKRDMIRLEPILKSKEMIEKIKEKEKLIDKKHHLPITIQKSLEKLKYVNFKSNVNDVNGIDKKK